MRKSLLIENKKDNKIDVLFYFDSQQNYARPVQLFWQGQDWQLAGVESWYVTRHHGVLTHHYLVSNLDGERSFELAFETENLTWRLKKTRFLELAQDQEPNLFAQMMGSVELAS